MMTETELVTVRQITERLQNAASFAAMLMMQIDGADEITTELKNRFSAAVLRTQEGVDMAQQLDDALDAFATQLQWQKARIDAGLATIEDRKEALKKQIKEVVEANPEISFRNSAGKKMYVRASNPALKITIPTKKTSFSNVLLEESVSVPDRFLSVTEVYTIDTAAVKKALEAGEEISWATLEQKMALCGL